MISASNIEVLISYATFVGRHNGLSPEVAARFAAAIAGDDESSIVQIVSAHSIISEKQADVLIETAGALVSYIKSLR